MNNNDLNEGVSKVSKVRLPYSHKKTVTVTFPGGWTHSFKIDSALWEGFKRFCMALGRTVGECLAEAIIEYMRSHVPPQTVINIIKPERVNVNIATKLELKLIKQDLTGVLETLKRPGADKHFFLQRLKDLVNKAIRLYEQTGDEELQRLLSKADELI